MTTLASRVAGLAPTASNSRIEEPDTNFSQSADFIPFASSSPPPPPPSEDGNRAHGSVKKGKGKDTSPASPVREWGKGQGDSEKHEQKMDPGSQEHSKEQNRSAPRDASKHPNKRKHDTDPDTMNGSKKQRTDDSLRKAPWIENIDWDRCRNVADMLNDEVEAFVQYFSPTDAEHEVRSRVVELISNTITQQFRDAKVYPFGSFATRLYLPHGDIDLVIVSESMARSNRVNVLHSLANTLKRAQITNKVSIIAKAKVPIIKFVANYGQINVDISINQGNGVHAGKIVNGFLQDMEGRGQGLALRSLIMFTKLFLSQRGLNEVFSGGLGSYSIVCLAVSFLQMHPKIRFAEIDADKNLGVLLMEFLELYGSYFNYDQVGISLRDGGTYFNKRARGWMDSVSYRLCIEDPADASNDISKGSYGIAKVRTTLAGAHGILTAASYLRAGILESRREGRFFKLRHRYDPEELSILSTVVTVSQEMIDRRRLVQDLFDKQPSQKQHSSSHVEVKRVEIGRSLKKRHSTQARTKAVESVLQLWNDEVEDQSRYHAKKLQVDSDEEGRYAIEERRFKKVQKQGRDVDVHTVFRNDEESEVEMEQSSDGEGWAYNYTVEASRSRKGAKVTTRTSATARVEERRSYWLSKRGSMREGDENT